GLLRRLFPRSGWQQAQRLRDERLILPGTGRGTIRRMVEGPAPTTDLHHRQRRTAMQGKSLYDYPIHLGLGAKAISEPEFTGFEWYDAYEKRHHDDLD